MVVLLVCAAGAAYAQFGRGFGGFFRVRPRFADANTFGHGFNYCRVMYTSNRREAGGQGWSTDYPDAERNFSKRLAELTEFVDTMSAWYGQLRRLPPGGWKQLAKMGGAIAKLAGGGR